MSFRIRAFGATAVGARGFSVGGRELVTLVLKVTCRVDPRTAGLAPIEPRPIVPEERHLRNNPLGSLTHINDLALVVPKAEILVLGSANAPRGTKVQSIEVRISLHRGGRAIMDKALAVVSPTPFESLPIVYERSLGGLSSRTNPAGVGVPPDTTQPNISYAGPSTNEGPVGFGPIPGGWPFRQSKRGPLSHAEANAKPWVELPEGFDESYFQCAPPDQRVGELLPGDVLQIVGMNPDLNRFGLTIPKARAVAVAQSARGELRRMTLRLDTLFVDVETLTAELLFRGATQLSRADAEATFFGAALDTPDAPFTFPDLSGTPKMAAYVPAPDQLTTRGTHILEPKLPPVQHVPKRDEIPADRRSSTVLIEEPVLPNSLPFERTEHGRGKARAPQVAPPGSPWAKTTEPAARPAASDLTSTFVIDPEPPPVSPPPPAPPPPAAEKKPESEPPPAKREPAWRVDPPEPAAPPRETEIKTPKADLSKHLYKKMKR